MFDFQIHLTKTTEVVADAIAQAEAAAQRHIRRFYHNANEEFVTFLLYGQIQHKLACISEKGIIEKCFVEDITDALLRNTGTCPVSQVEIQSSAKGLIADILLHNRRTEGRTGGDFGLLFFSPTVKVEKDGISILRNGLSGLLCQAKIKSESKGWGTFTTPQKKALPEHLEYLVLALYSYSDSERKCLRPINWALCQNQSFQQISTHLQNDSFPNLQSTKSIIQALSKGEIGTNDKATIDKVISPSGKFWLEIRIHWKNDDEPTEPIRIAISNQSHVKADNSEYVHVNWI